MGHFNYVQMHIGDFLTGVLHMNAEETGAYIMLIMAHYQAGEKGLPNHDKKLSRIAKVTPRKWSVIKETVMEKFTLKDNFFTQKRVVNELKRVQEVSQRQSAKALKRHDADNATAKPRQCQPITNNQEPLEKDKDKSLSKKNDQIEQFDFDFDRFWEAFPRQRRGSKANAQRAYKDALSRASPDEIFSGLQAYCDSEEVAKGFAKGAQAWLNDDRWTNDYSRKVEHGTTGFTQPKKFTSADAAASAKAKWKRMESQPDSGPCGPMLCDARQVRNDSGGIGDQDARDDGGFTDLSFADDRRSVQDLEEISEENPADSGYH